MHFNNASKNVQSIGWNSTVWHIYLILGGIPNLDDLFDYRDFVKIRKINPNEERGRIDGIYPKTTNKNLELGEVRAGDSRSVRVQEDI